jgi:BirA family transcriptional regulator, biotin operon repressor / biotin---[acetyl-CoA-carboxylase] ligase
MQAFKLRLAQNIPHLYLLVVYLEFNLQKLRHLLQPGLTGTKCLQFNCHWLAEVTSTNQSLWERSQRQEVLPGTVVIAGQQTAGRGQWGRQWQSLPGGLYLSVLLTPNIRAQSSAEITLCSAWGIAQKLRDVGVPVQLKWPNDLVLSGLKLGGILTETRIAQQYITKAVIGIGINWQNPVPETGMNLQSFLGSNQLTQRLMARSHSLPTSLEELAAIVLQGLALGYQTWQRSGIDAILPAYNSVLANLGQSIQVNGQLGTIVGVTRTGELRIQLSPGDSSGSEVTFKPGMIRLGYGQSTPL